MSPGPLLAASILFGAGSALAAAEVQVAGHEIHVSNAQLDVQAISDLRFDASDELLVAAVREGVARLRLTPDATILEKRLAVRAHGAWGWTATRLARSDRFIAAGQVVGSVSWVARTGGDVHAFHGFDAIHDLDLYGDTIAVMAARRENRSGPYAPDGAIVSIGTLGETLERLRPLYVSVTGPGAQPLERCGFMRLGNVRFLRDGRLIVQPGVEPGIYRYSRAGVLERSWRTDTLGIDSDCTLDEAESAELATDLEPRIAWLNARTIVDEIVPMDDGPGLIVRQVSDTAATWQLLILHDDGEVEPLPLPFRRADNQRLKADTDGERIAFLFFDTTSGPRVPQEIVVMPAPASARPVAGD